MSNFFFSHLTSCSQPGVHKSLEDLWKGFWGSANAVEIRQNLTIFHQYHIDKSQKCDIIKQLKDGER